MFAPSADYVDKIIKDKRPLDLPMEQPTTFEFVVNLKAARALGIKVPQEILLQATSEMIIKAAQMGILIVVSRSGITEMGLQVAQRIGLCAVGRATNKNFLCFSAPQRLHLQPSLAGTRLRVAA